MSQEARFPILKLGRDGRRVYWQVLQVDYLDTSNVCCPPLWIGSVLDQLQLSAACVVEFMVRVDSVDARESKQLEPIFEPQALDGSGDRSRRPGQNGRSSVERNSGFVVEGDLMNGPLGRGFLSLCFRLNALLHAISSALLLPSISRD